MWLKNIQRALFTLSILSIQQSSILAQKLDRKHRKMDYLITNNNDTIFGKFKKAFMGDLKFEDEGSGDVYVDPTLYKAYYSYDDRRVYNRVITPKKTYWFTLIVDGRIQLYEQTDFSNTRLDGRIIPIRRWIARKDNGTIVNVKSSGMEDIKNEGITNLEYLIRDDEKLFNYVQSMRNFSFANVKLIIETYNQEMPKIKENKTDSTTTAQP